MIPSKASGSRSLPGPGRSAAPVVSSSPYDFLLPTDEKEELRILVVGYLLFEVTVVEHKCIVSAAADPSQLLTTMDFPRQQPASTQ